MTKCFIKQTDAHVTLDKNFRLIRNRKDSTECCVMQIQTALCQSPFIRIKLFWPHNRTIWIIKFHKTHLTVPQSIQHISLRLTCMDAPLLQILEHHLVVTKISNQTSIKIKYIHLHHKSWIIWANVCSSGEQKISWKSEFAPMLNDELSEHVFTRHVWLNLDLPGLKGQKYSAYFQPLKYEE